MGRNKNQRIARPGPMTLVVMVCLMVGSFLGTGWLFDRSSISSVIEGVFTAVFMYGFYWWLYRRQQAR